MTKATEVDEAIIKYYRMLLRAGFEHAGTLDSPTVVLDAVGENIRICDHVGTDSLQVHIKIKNGLIDEIKYLCTCDPATNVAVEIMCALAEGKTLAGAGALSLDSFSGVLGSESEDLLKKARGLMELLSRGITRYRTEDSA